MKIPFYILFTVISFTCSGQREIKAIKYTYQDRNFINDSIPNIWTRDISYEAVSEQYWINKSWQYSPDSTLSSFELNTLESNNLEYLVIHWSNPNNNDGFNYNIGGDKIDTLKDLMYELNINVSEIETIANLLVSRFVGDSIQMDKYQLMPETITYYTARIDSLLYKIEPFSVVDWHKIELSSLEFIEREMVPTNEGVTEWNRDFYNSECALNMEEHNRTRKFARKHFKRTIKEKEYEMWIRDLDTGHDIYEFFF